MSIIEKAVDKMMGKSESSLPKPRADKAAAQSPTPRDPAVDEAGMAEDGSRPFNAPEEPAAVASEPYKEPLASQLESTSAELEPAPAKPARVPAVGSEARGEERILNITALGLEGVLSPDSERSRTAEEYRMIKRPLLTRALSRDADGDTHRNLVMITSSVEGEGKTFSSLNLAISIAMEMDRTVLLVDADLAKPGLSRLLKVSNLPGLTDRLIDGNLDLRDLLIKTDIPKFSVLPAGRRHRRSTELLASNVMRSLLDELALRYSDRVVLFDSPPLLATSEASVLADQMGQICLVVESGVTPQFLVQDAIAKLSSPEHVSLLLNKCKPDLFIGKYGYGYGSGYGYGYGYGYGNDEK